MKISICSYSFHRLLASGKQDIFQYIEDCKALGCTQLDPWNVHLSKISDGNQVLHIGANPAQSHHLAGIDDDYLAEVKLAADRAGLPFGCIAVDGAHIYEEKEEDRRRNREKAYRWIAIAKKLGASQIRIDTGGPADMPDSVFEIIVEGYKDVIKRAQETGLEVLVENHWGPTNDPDNVVKLMEALPDLGLLLDSWNWNHGKQAEGWLKCVKYAKLTHTKTFVFTDDGQELTQNIPAFCKLLVDSGYTGCWGVESIPADGDEIAGARNTIKLIKRSVH